MESFFNPQEINYIRDKLDFDIRFYTERFLYLERSLRLIQENRLNHLFLVERLSENREEFLNVKEAFILKVSNLIYTDSNENQIKLNLDETQTLRSLKYYLKSESEGYDKLREHVSRGDKTGAQNDDLIHGQENTIRACIGSILNTLMFIIEESNKIDGKYGSKNCVAIFEACPPSLDPIRTNAEAKNIRDLLNLSPNYFPIVRYATNLNTIRNIYKNYAPKVLHFCCHGSPDDGSLQLLDLVQKNCFSYNGDKLTDDINQYISKDVGLVYLNSCYSSKMFNHICYTCNYVRNVIGCEGKNYDNKALEFSNGYYQIVATEKYDISTFEKHFMDEKKNYANLNPDDDYINVLLFQKF